MSAADRITELGNILETCVDGKSAIAEAITSKGVPTEPDASFDSLAVNVGLIEGGGAKTTVINANVTERGTTSLNLDHDPTFPIMVIGKKIEAPEAFQYNWCWMNGTFYDGSRYAQFQVRSSGGGLLGSPAFRRGLCDLKNNVDGRTIYVSNFDYSISYPGDWKLTIIEGIPINQFIDEY